LLSVVSHTALVQTRDAAPTVQVAFSTGFMCGGSLGMSVPLGSFAVHVCDVSSHQSPPAQSASTLHPPAGSHLPLVLHTPERHTVPPLPVGPEVQGPSPLA
jgi:hypothetical protein